MNQQKIFHDSSDEDEADSFFWSILWDTDDQRYELFYFDGDGAPDCDELWADTDIPVHHCDDSGESDRCTTGEYEHDEGENNQSALKAGKDRYKRAFDTYYMSGTAL